MRKKRILLFSAKGLLGEGVEQMLNQLDDLELAGHWRVDDTFMEKLRQAAPDLVILADEGKTSESLSRLTAQILDEYPNLPILRVTLDNNQVQIYSSHLAAASRHDFLDLIYRLPIQD